MSDEAYLASTRYSLINFTTGELYTLSNPYRGYSIRDYIVRYDFEEQGDNDKYIDLMVIYAPERMWKNNTGRICFMEHVQPVNIFL